MHKTLGIVMILYILSGCLSLENKKKVYYSKDKRSLLVLLENKTCLIFTDDCLIDPQKISYDQVSKTHFVDGYNMFCNREIQNNKNVILEIDISNSNISIKTTDTCVNNKFENFLGKEFYRVEENQLWDSVTVADSFLDKKYTINSDNVNFNSKINDLEYPLTTEDLVKVFLFTNLKIHDLPVDVNYYPLKVTAYHRGNIIKELKGDKTGCLWKGFRKN